MCRFHLGLILCCMPAFLHAQAEPEKPLDPPFKPSDFDHWAFRKVVRPQVPKFDSAWVRNPVDAFVLHKLHANGLAPGQAADPLTLLRRVTLDLTGLLPTIAETDLYSREANANPDTAYEKLVERLLASPHYGERGAQHWLDVVRYAESNGYEGDAERPNAWRYRDYVVKALNDDKPFDRFLTEQIAGDELATGKDARAHADLWIATGFHRCGPAHVVSGNVDSDENRNEALTEMVQGIGSAFLGLTINCARCHDHKFDPISQADYYRLEAFFASARLKELDFSTPDERTAHQLKLLTTLAKLTPIKARVTALDAPYQNKIRELKKAKLEARYRDALDVDAKRRTPEQEKLAKEAQTLLKVTWDEILAAMSSEDRERRAALRAQQHAVEAELPMPPSQASAVADDGKPVVTHILIRGEVKKKGPTVESACPRILRGRHEANSAALKRTDLAQWLTSPEHPLTARVFVNRLWQHHFGRGIVATPNDFGKRGAAPTHPELLDWLAAEFVQNGWKIKPLHRLIVLSSTYRQASGHQALDPDNKLLGHMNRQRLEGEALRDAILTAAGTLNREVGGPMIRVPLEPEVYDLIFTEGEPDGLWPVTADARQHSRRSLYLFAKRNVRQPLLEAFDQPDALTPCAQRAVSTFAPQALILMNGPFAHAQSRAMASQLLRDAGNDRDSAIGAAYRRCFTRLPQHEEREIARAFLDKQTETIRDRMRSRLKVAIPDQLPPHADVAEGAALADFCLALFNANEFVYVR